MTEDLKQNAPKQRRFADRMFVGMLVMSLFLSLVLIKQTFGYINHHPQSSFTHFMQSMMVKIGANAVFLLLFFVLCAISYVIYRKILGGKILSFELNELDKKQLRAQTSNVPANLNVAEKILMTTCFLTAFVNLLIFLGAGGTTALVGLLDLVLSLLAGYGILKQKSWAKGIFIVWSLGCLVAILYISFLSCLAGAGGPYWFWYIVLGLCFLSFIYVLWSLFYMISHYGEKRAESKPRNIKLSQGFRKSFIWSIAAIVSIASIYFSWVQSSYNKKAEKSSIVLNLIKTKEKDKIYSLFVTKSPYFGDKPHSLDAQKRYVNEGLNIMSKYFGDLEKFKLKKVTPIDVMDSYERGKLNHFELTTVQGTGFMSEVYLCEYKVKFSKIGWIKLIIDLRKYHEGSNPLQGRINLLEVGAIEIFNENKSMEKDFEEAKEELNTLRKDIYDSTGIIFAFYRPLTH